MSAADAFSLLSEYCITVSTTKCVPWKSESTAAGATQGASYKNMIGVSVCAAVSHSVESVDSESPRLEEAKLVEAKLAKSHVEVPAICWLSHNHWQNFSEFSLNA